MLRNKGLLITFEGVEGCGKTTQINILEKYFKKKKIKVLRTKEPGGTNLGKKIRQILLKSNMDLFIPYTELFLFAADRLEHVEKIIKPGILQGKIVLCDRYIDSTVAYQIGGRHLNKKIVNIINKISSRSIKPDLTIVFDIKIKEGLKRATKIRRDRIEKEGIEFHKRVAKQYYRIAKKEKRRVKLISVDNRSINEIHRDVVNTIEKHIKTLKKSYILDKI